MRYFLDTEFNDYEGELISIALVGEDGREIYVQIPAAHDQLLTPWVAKNVTPYLLGTLEYPARPMMPMQRNSASIAIGAFLMQDPEPMVLADHPIDISHLCRLLELGPGKVFPLPALQCVFVAVPDFNVTRDSKVPHNALWDARALRDHVLSFERSFETVEAPLVALEDDASGD